MHFFIVCFPFFTWLIPWCTAITVMGTQRLSIEWISEWLNTCRAKSFTLPSNKLCHWPLNSFHPQYPRDCFGFSTWPNITSEWVYFQVTITQTCCFARRWSKHHFSLLGDGSKVCVGFTFYASQPSLACIPCSDLITCLSVISVC